MVIGKSLFLHIEPGLDPYLFLSEHYAGLSVVGFQKTDILHVVDYGLSIKYCRIFSTGQFLPLILSSANINNYAVLLLLLQLIKYRFLCCPVRIHIDNDGTIILFLHGPA